VNGKLMVENTVINEFKLKSDEIKDLRKDIFLKSGN